MWYKKPFCITLPPPPPLPPFLLLCPCPLVPSLTSPGHQILTPPKQCSFMLHVLNWLTHYYKISIDDMLLTLLS